LEIDIRVLTHSSIRLRGSKVIYVDPYDVREDFHDADFVLITHDHYDHFSPDDIAKVVKADTRIVVPGENEGSRRLMLSRRMGSSIR